MMTPLVPATDLYYRPHQTAYDEWIMMIILLFRYYRRPAHQQLLTRYHTSRSCPLSVGNQLHSPITSRPTTTACVLNRRQNIPRARATRDLSSEHVQFSSERAACQCSPPPKTVFFWIPPFCLCKRIKFSSLSKWNLQRNLFLNMCNG